MIVNTEGIILRQVNFQESDKILTIFSRKNGKIQAIAKGARKPRSSLIASTQVFCYSSFIMYKGRNFYNISQGEVLSSFYTLRDDLEKLAYGAYIMELIDAAITEEEQNDTLFKLLLKTLKILSHMEKDYSKLVRAFELKYVSFIGYKPHINKCIVCGKLPEHRVRFSIQSGGIVCPNCMDRDHFGEDIDKETLKAMNDLLYCQLDQLETLEISKKVLTKIKGILIRYIMAHVDRKKFKALDFLNAIEK